MDYFTSLALALSTLTEGAAARRELDDLLRQADASRGSARPVLGIGRDGMTVRESRCRFYEVGTVYLVAVPEPNQLVMNCDLTARIEGCSGWPVRRIRRCRTAFSRAAFSS